MQSFLQFKNGRIYYKSVKSTNCKFISIYENYAFVRYYNSLAVYRVIVCMTTISLGLLRLLKH